MKPLALALAAALCGCAASHSQLTLKPLPSANGDVERLLDNITAVRGNIQAMLTVYREPHRFTPEALSLARRSLLMELGSADRIIQEADAALARELPRTRPKMFIAFAPFATDIDGRDDKLNRQIATAQSQVLAYQFCLLNLKTAVDTGKAEASRAGWEKGLAQARQDLAALWKKSG